MSKLLKRISDNALHFPERIAFCAEIATDSSDPAYDTLTWAELDRRSDILAARIGAECAGNTPVVVYGHKESLMPVCFLACVKSGRAYCPVDISMPEDRVISIIDEVKPELVLCVDELAAEGYRTVSRAEMTSWLEEGSPYPQRVSPVDGDDVFYIIFTSGSTGRPKGVQITADCLDSFLLWMEDLIGRCSPLEHHTFINQAPFSFDLSVMDLYSSLYLGGTLWSLPKSTQNDMRSLFASLSRSHATVWVSTPSFADMCNADRQFCAALMPELSLFLFCGEALSNTTAGKLKEKFPGAEVVNTYGPTESTVAVTEIIIDNNILSSFDTLPIGREKPNTRIFVEENGRELPDGEKGELVIVGDSVSPGYYKRPELTSGKFELRELDGRQCRAYHTGDLGYRADGLLFYSGRMDFQVKLHGYRIELEDIEANIMKLPGVSKAAVVPTMRDGKVRHLTAYVSLCDPSSAEKGFEAAQRLKKDLRKLIPEYMIPKNIRFLDSLPMTNNGKVDRRLLQESLK